MRTVSHGVNDASERTLMELGRAGLLRARDEYIHCTHLSLSSDVDVTMAQDPFTIMRAAFTLQRLLVLQRARKGETGLPPLLTCRDVLEFATVEGARCANLERKVGTLTPGKEADIVMRSLPSGRAERGPGGARRRGEPDEPRRRGDGVHRWPREEMARRSRRRRHAARAQARRGRPRRRRAKERVQGEFGGVASNNPRASHREPVRLG